MLQVLYKLKTAKVFDRNRSKEDKGSTEVSDEDPFAIQIMAWCPESRMLCVAGVSANVIIYRFSKLEVTTEVVQVGNILWPEFWLFAMQYKERCCGGAQIRLTLYLCIYSKFCFCLFAPSTHFL